MVLPPSPASAARVKAAAVMTDSQLSRSALSDKIVSDKIVGGAPRRNDRAGVNADAEGEVVGSCIWKDSVGEARGGGAG